jgi:outer membrane protein OmpA-like peptidoglycan-associated protein
MRLSLIVGILPALLLSCTPVSRITVDPFVAEDALPPSGYNPVYMAGAVPFTGTERNARLSIDRVIQIDTARTQIAVHYLDENGFHLTGAGTGGSKGRWCVLVDSVNGSSNVLRPGQYEATEQNDTTPVAFSIVLDHSGSMGNERARILQSAINDVIREKLPQDGIAVARFDSRTGVERSLARDRNPIQENGLEGFGGLTAIWDGTSRGIDELKSSLASQVFPRRAVVVFTDGSDNSSAKTIEQLVPTARASGIQIYTVAFGIHIGAADEQRLGRLAALTGGKYYKIYGRDEFRFVFQDIYRRFKSYYLFSFDLSAKGIHSISIKLCNQSDGLVARTVIDNRTGDSALRIPMPAYTPPPIMLTFDELLFEKGSARLRPEITSQLDVIRDYMMDDPGLSATVEGHTSNTMGTPVGTLIKLSRQRANAVVNYLVQKGIPAGRLTAMGHGPNHPIAPQSPDAAAARNRRVEVYFRK